MRLYASLVRVRPAHRLDWSLYASMCLVVTSSVAGRSGERLFSLHLRSDWSIIYDAPSSSSFALRRTLPASLHAPVSLRFSSTLSVSFLSIYACIPAPAITAYSSTERDVFGGFLGCQAGVSAALPWSFLQPCSTGQSGTLTNQQLFRSSWPIERLSDAVEPYDPVAFAPHRKPIISQDGPQDSRDDDPRCSHRCTARPQGKKNPSGSLELALKQGRCNRRACSSSPGSNAKEALDKLLVTAVL